MSIKRVQPTGAARRVLWQFEVSAGRHRRLIRNVRWQGDHKDGQTPETPLY
jgi:hypothetical protein